MASSVFVGWFGGGAPWSWDGTTASLVGSLSVSGQYLGEDGSASAPTYSFSSEPDFGFYRAGTRSLYLVGASGAKLTGFGSAGIVFRSGDSLSWSSISDASGSADLFLVRDAANTLAQRNGTNAQTFNIYNTYTSSTNKEFGALRWASNRFQIWTDVGSGGGTARSMDMVSTGSDMTFYVGGSASGNKVINLTGTGVMFPNDNLYDIGASGANRPRTVYVATSVIAGATGNDGYRFGSFGGFYSSGADGKFQLLLNSTSTGVGLDVTTDGTLKVRNRAQNADANLSAAAATLSGTLTLAGGTLLATSAALTNGAAAQVATLTNGPTAGNPTKWIPINDNGTTRYFPVW